MTKGALIELLEPFTDEIQIRIDAGQHCPVIDVTDVKYEHAVGEGYALLIPNLDKARCEFKAGAA